MWGIGHVTTAGDGDRSCDYYRRWDIDHVSTAGDGHCSYDYSKTKIRKTQALPYMAVWYLYPTPANNSS